MRPAPYVLCVSARQHEGLRAARPLGRWRPGRAAGRAAAPLARAPPPGQRLQQVDGLLGSAQVVQQDVQRRIHLGGASQPANQSEAGGGTGQTPWERVTGPHGAGLGRVQRADPELSPCCAPPPPRPPPTARAPRSPRRAARAPPCPRRSAARGRLRAASRAGGRARLSRVRPGEERLHVLHEVDQTVRHVLTRRRRCACRCAAARAIALTYKGRARSLSSSRCRCAGRQGMPSLPLLGRACTLPPHRPAVGVHLLLRPSQRCAREVLEPVRRGTASRRCGVRSCTCGRRCSSCRTRAVHRRCCALDSAPLDEGIQLGDVLRPPTQPSPRTGRHGKWMQASAKTLRADAGATQPAQACGLPDTTPPPQLNNPCRGRLALAP
jgi:hypothetical protein